MARATQKRTLETRARLIAAAEAIVAEVGFEALRVEEVVLRAGTAKGTFFVHFKDKDTLMDLIIGPRIDAHLDALQAGPAPRTIEEMTGALMPLCDLMTCERYVFDVILRYSGAAGVAEIGPIASTFGRQIEIFAQWFDDAPFRRDVTADLLAEGVQAFVIQAMAAQFCALHNSQSIRERLEPYLRAWLTPAAGGT
ncbi:MAG: TetR/AcrR family transcriptional regulator [Phycisphaerales bacterium]|jgi:AcrR family transcriptional regulator|nr:TetR/AcrR family transcriptional regulator [Phycisphaerales bacterium]